VARAGLVAAGREPPVPVAAHGPLAAAVAPHEQLGKAHGPLAAVLAHGRPGALGKARER
jgi:hypothetical protein